MQITVAQVPVLLGTGNLTLQNHGPDDLWLGGSDVSEANGLLLASGVGQDFPSAEVGRLYAVSSGTSDVRYLAF